MLGWPAGYTTKPPAHPTLGRQIQEPTTKLVHRLPQSGFMLSVLPRDFICCCLAFLFEAVIAGHTCCGVVSGPTSPRLFARTAALGTYDWCFLTCLSSFFHMPATIVYGFLAFARPNPQVGLWGFGARVGIWQISIHNRL